MGSTSLDGVSRHFRRLAHHLSQDYAESSESELVARKDHGILITWGATSPAGRNLPTSEVDLVRTHNRSVRLLGLPLLAKTGCRHGCAPSEVALAEVVEDTSVMAQVQRTWR